MENIIITYTIISYLIGIGVLMNQPNLALRHFIWFVFSPIGVPILIGMRIND